MIEFELIPKQGISDIRFGMEKSEVRKLMEQNYNVKVKSLDKDYYFDSCLQFNYENNTLSFIEVAIGSPPPFKLRVFNTAIHKIGEKRLFELLEKEDELDTELSEENSPLFKNNIITLWRRFKNKKWEAVGIGDDRFYRESVRIMNEYKD